MLEALVETPTARKDNISGLAVASDERIEAYVLYVTRGMEETEIVSLRSSSTMLEPVCNNCSLNSAREAWRPLRFLEGSLRPRSQRRIETLKFNPVGVHRPYAATAKSAQC